MAKLPKSLTRVTGFSKVLALLMFLAFIASAFYAGFLFDEQYRNLAITISPTPSPSTQTMCQTDSDCTLTTADVAASCCPNTRCLNFADATTIAVNVQWLESQKTHVCGASRICPMFATMCTRDIVAGNSHYSAKCVRDACQKVRE